MTEHDYEAIELILKKRSDGKVWFDVLFDILTEGCAGVSIGIDEDNIGDAGCTCSLEHMGGTSGTLEVCYGWLG